VGLAMVMGVRNFLLEIHRRVGVEWRPCRSWPASY
jgi:hypothetical protein